jgi:hypothetical protein
MRRILKQPIPDLLDRVDKEFTNSPLALKSALSRTVFICRQSVKASPTAEGHVHGAEEL